MADTENKAKGPNGRGGNGFSFDDRGGGGGSGRGRGGPGGRDGDRRGGRGGKDDRRGGGSNSFRIVTELSSLEKALSKADFVGQKGPLDEILKALKPMHLKSLEQLDMGTRGKLLTSLMRVVRQPRPKVAIAGAEPAAVTGNDASDSGASSDGSGVQSAAAHGVSTDTDATSGAMPDEASTVTAADHGATDHHGVTVEAPSEVSSAVKPEARAESGGAPAASPPSYGDVAFTVGLIWQVLNDGDRAMTAFEAAGRQPTEADLAALAAPTASASHQPARSDRPARTPNRPERPPRAPRPTRPARETSGPFQTTGDWQADAQRLEEMGRTRDAGRIHEKHQGYEWATRLYEIGGDFKAALRTAALGKHDEKFKTLSEKFKPEEIIQVLERAEAWEKLMEFHVGRADFDSVAKLYERAKQFDQAALAWERAGKLSAARKAYERVKDLAGANRVRELEVKKLIERGDRLGAATILVGADRTSEALEVLKPLPPPKTFHFMQKLKLDEAAKVFASEHLQKAIDEQNLQQKARWQELLGDLAAAAQTWLESGRKDKASWVFEQLGELPKAAELAEAAGQLDKAQALFKRAGDQINHDRVAALPRPEPKPQTAAQKAEDEAQELMAPPPVDNPGEPKAEAHA